MGTIIVKGWCLYLLDNAFHIFTLYDRGYDIDAVMLFPVYIVKNCLEILYRSL